MKTLTIVVPIYKDGFLAEEFCAATQELMQNNAFSKVGVSHVSVLFISDGIVSDHDFLLKACQRYSFAKSIFLSRNFGQHIAISCGLHHCDTDLACYTDVDMEDPVSELPKLIQALDQTKSNICIGFRQIRHATLLKRLTSQAFHIFLSKLTGLSIPDNCTTMRVMNRQFLDIFRMVPEQNRYLPGLEAWLGLPVSYIEIQHQVRNKGQSSYNFTKRLNLAFTAVLSFSDYPLRLAVRLGFLITGLSFIMGGYLVASKIFSVNYQPGFTTTTALIMFFGGFQIFVTGVMGLYVGRILSEVQHRPLYVIREKIGF